MNIDELISNQIAPWESTDAQKRREFNSRSIDPSVELNYDSWSWTYHTTILNLILDYMKIKVEQYLLSHPKADVSVQLTNIANMEWSLRWLDGLRYEHGILERSILAGRLENLKLLDKIQDLAKVIKEKEKEIEILKSNL